MEDKRTQIEQALAKLISRKRWYDFQLLALQLARRKWPDLDPTEWRDDGGEDGITIPSQCSDGLRRSLACSLSGTLDKVRKDCRRIINRGVHVDDLVFYTPVVVTNLEIAEWQKKIQEEFGHSLQVIPQAPIIADLEQPDNAWLCRDYLELNFADEPDVAGLATRVRTVALASIQQWKAEYGYNPITHIQLTLRQESKEEDQKGAFLNVKEACEIAQSVRRLTLKGPPGAGKTITLLQLAIQLAENPQGPIPILISLPVLPEYWEHP